MEPEGPSTSARKQSWTWLDLGIAIGLVVLSLIRLGPAIEDVSFHRDEARWIGNSALLREWRHPLGIRWQDEGYPSLYGSFDESVRRRSQPPLAMYVIGLGLIVQGHGLPDHGYWIMNFDTDWNIEHGNMPSASQLTAARRANVAITIATVLLVYATGRRLTNRVGGSFGAVVFAIHPLTLDTGARAWSDPLLVLCLALAAWLAVRLADRPTWWRAALLGVALGLGAATKLSPLLLSVGMAALGAAILVFRRDARTLACQLLAQPVIAFATLVAVYPYLWVSPIRNTYRMFEFRSRSFDMQAVAFPPAAVADRADAFRRLGRELADRFSAAGQISEWLGHEPESWIREVDLTLAVLGLLVLAVLAIRAGLTSAPTLAMAVLGGQAALIVLTIGVEYARYLYPILLANAVFSGVAVGAGWRIVVARLRSDPRLGPGSDRQAAYENV